MASYDQRSLQLARFRGRRLHTAAGLDDLRRRAVRLLARRGGEDPDTQTTAVTARLPEETSPSGEEGAPRFPLARHGYDRLAVDRHLDELEQELAELDRELVALRTAADSSEQVKSEIRRVGEQTSAVLVAAHQQREEMLRGAWAEADRLVSDARASARAITASAEAQVRELETQNEAARRERDRLLDDFQTIAGGLVALVESVRE